MKEWSKEIKHLTQVAVSQPHAAYAVFTHGISSRWSYVLRTIPEIHDILLPLEDTIRQLFISALTGRPTCYTLERDLWPFLSDLGDSAFINPATLSPTAFQASEQLTGPLEVLIVSQEMN